MMIVLQSVIVVIGRVCMKPMPVNFRNVRKSFISTRHRDNSHHGRYP